MPFGAFNPYQGVSNTIALAPGEEYTLGPEAGWYEVVLSPYHLLQYLDPNMAAYRSLGSGVLGGQPQYVYSDGVRVRIVNQTGAPVGALLTNGGTGYTSAPTVAASAGGSTWRALLGGAVNTSVTVTAAGQNYTYAPICFIDPPQRGGIQATAIATLSSSAVSSVTIIDQGAGYINPPNITFLNDPREINSLTLTDGYGAAAALSLTGAGTVTGVLCINVGTAGLTALPTLTFSGGGGTGAAATALMNWTITAYAAGTAGAGLAGTVARITAEDAFPTTAPAYTNVTTQKNLVFTRSADIKAPISAGGITATGAIIYDGGCYTSSPTPLVIPTASVVTTAPVVTFTMGGANGVSFVSRVG